MTLPIGCIIVTFNPDVRHLQTQLLELQSISQEIVVVDNSTDVFLKQEIFRIIAETSCTVIQQSENFGIGAALNQGLKLLGTRGVQRVMFLDDDSFFPAEQIEFLIASFDEIRVDNPRIIGAGPSVKDIKNGVILSYSWQNNILKIAPQNDIALEVAFLVSSGSLYDMTALLSEIGYLREDYFLDGTDMEYGFRITSKGYKLVTFSSIEMEHSLGDRVSKVGSNKYEFEHFDPGRIYYQTRNHLLMLRDTPIGMRRKFFRVVQIFHHFNLSRKLLHRDFSKIRMFIMGILDALLNRRGPLSRG